MHFVGLHYVTVSQFKLKKHKFNIVSVFMKFEKSCWKCSEDQGAKNVCGNFFFPAWRRLFRIFSGTERKLLLADTV